MAKAQFYEEGLTTIMKDLNLSQRTELVKGDSTYILEIALQNGESPLIAAATSENKIHLLAKEQFTSTRVLSGHTGKITGLSFGHSDHHALFSSSADGTVRCWDVRTPRNKEEQKFAAPAGVESEILCVDTSQSDRLICAGTETSGTDEAQVLFWDRRKGSLLGSYKESHDNDVNQVRFKPGSDNVLASGSSDGLLNTFDLNETCEEDALQMTFNPESDIELIGWCGKNYDDLYCVTTDSAFHIWDSMTGDDRCHVPGPSSLPTDGTHAIEYIVDCIPELTKQGEDRNEAMIVAGNYNGCLSFVGVSSDDRHRHLKSLPGAHHATIRCARWDSQSKSMLTAGEDSVLCLWVLDSDGSPSGKITQRVAKMKVKEKKEHSRKKPYGRQEATSHKT